LAAAALIVASCDLFPSLGGLSAPDGGKFCDGVDAYLCADFDDGFYLPGWTGLELSNGVGTVGVDDAQAFSAPFSLRSTIAVPDGGAVARLGRALPPTAKHIHVSYRLLVPAPPAPANGWIDPVEILCGDAPNGLFSGFWLRLSSAGDQLWANGGAQTFDVSVPLQTWTLLELDVVYGGDGGSPSHVKLIDDGAVEVDNDTSEAPCALPQFELNLGQSGQGDFTTYSDNVIVQVE
jgi:hypothetical protein